MEVNIKGQTGKITISLGGKFSFADAPDFNQVISAIEKPGVTGCEFDLRNLKSIDSSGLGMLLKAHDISKTCGFSVSLSGAQGIVRESLNLTKMGNLFQIS